MNKTLRYINRLCAAAVTLVAAAACSGLIFENEPADCETQYAIQFQYVYNMTGADAFASEVNALNVYIIDPDTHRLLYAKVDSGSQLAESDYIMNIDMEPGVYDVLVWAGTQVYGSWQEESRAYVTDLGRQLVYNTDDEGNAYVDTNIDLLFHGYVEREEFPDEEGIHTFSLSLVKDTKDIRIVLQNLTGEPIDEELFTFTFTCDNSALAWDNSLGESPLITYRPWSTTVASAEIETELNAGTYNAFAAEFTVPRLVTDHPARLTVTNNLSGETTLSIPFIDYALLIKSLYSSTSSLSDQEYLDRQDTYDMVFFLDAGYRWVNSYIYINSWKVVLQNADL